MKIAFISQGLGNPAWSSVNFFAAGTREIKEHEFFFYKATDFIPCDLDLYIELECGIKVGLNREQYKPFIYVILDLFESTDISWKLEAAKSADFVLTTSPLSCEILDKHGIKHSGFTTWGVYDNVWHPIDCDKGCDAAFIGNIDRKESRHRRVIIDELRGNGFNIQHSHLCCFLEDNAKFLNTGKIGLNIPNREFDSINQRDTECIGCGLPLITEKKRAISAIIPENLCNFYENDENIVGVFRETMYNLKERVQLAQKLREFFLLKYSYVEIMRRIINVIDGAKYDCAFYEGLKNA